MRNAVTALAGAAVIAAATIATPNTAAAGYGYYAPGPVYYDYYLPGPAYYGYYAPQPYVGCWAWRYGYRRAC